ncbi:uncharacterized protein JCM6883_002333 [Sporobolomyces salmoneus]|uniref:uncharacterized protein n=1 Tax=Sporobolomyces salmoneus TaxID=183962 RepID=UPI0031813A8D
MKGHADSSYLRPRIPAIQVPCPCSTLSARAASLVSTGGLVIVYLGWAVGLWYGYSAVDKLKAFVESSSSAFVELRQMATFALFSAWYFSTCALLSFASFVTSIFPQPELAKHLSRIIWLFGWIGTWFVGVYGLAAHLSQDTWLVAGCDRDDECELFRQRLQIWVMVSLFVTLALVFWFALVFSAFVHTLHPDIFHTGDVDSELDEYDHACLLEEELRNSDHPLAGEALEILRFQRESAGLDLARGREGFRSRKGYQCDCFSEESGSKSDTDDEKKDREALIGRERSNSRASRGRPASAQRQEPGANSDSESSSSSMEEKEWKGKSRVSKASEAEMRTNASLARSRLRSRSRSRSAQL